MRGVKARHGGEMKSRCQPLFGRGGGSTVGGKNVFFCLRGQFSRGFSLCTKPNGPGKNSESTQPSPLLFRKSPGPDLDAFEGIFGRAAAFEVIHNLSVPKGFPLSLIHI